MPIDGVSLAYTFDDADAAPQKHEQFFDNNGSRGLYRDGWFAGTLGPFIPWDTPGSAKRLATWDSDKDPWELYDLDADFSQADDLAAEDPARLDEMKKRFLEVAADERGFPDRRRQLAAPPPGGSGQDAPTTAGPSGPIRAACRSLRRRASAGRARR